MAAANYLTKPARACMHAGGVSPLVPAQPLPAPGRTDAPSCTDNHQPTMCTSRALTQAMQPLLIFLLTH